MDENDRKMLKRLEEHLRLIVNLDPDDRGDKELNEAERFLLGELEDLNKRLASD